ncbi:response regulator receiver sensor signal transduction histidine kinase [Candidatus Magnetoovum chiemensis]|nr:response regulator receiver sensor signal transduction histidine kinase [Candidatus Magnetoovum chiemensis]
MMDDENVLVNKTDREINILVIEDNAPDVALLRIALSKSTSVAITLTVAEMLSIGLKYLESRRYDVILLDLGLPDSKGIDTFKRIYQKVRDVPIVVLSGLDDEELAIKSVHEGAQDYLVKGELSYNLLIRSIRYAIERKRAEENLLLLKKQQQRVRELEKERNELQLNYKCYLTVAQNDVNAGGAVSVFDDREIFSKFKDLYKDLLVKFVKSVIFQEERPNMRHFCSLMADKKLKAKDIIRLHLTVLQDITNEFISPVEEQTFSYEARLSLIQLMGNIMDIYLKRAVEKLG